MNSSALAPLGSLAEDRVDMDKHIYIYIYIYREREIKMSKVMYGICVIRF